MMFEATCLPTTLNNSIDVAVRTENYAKIILKVSRPYW